MVIVNEVEALSGQTLEQRLDGWYACYKKRDDNTYEIMGYMSNEVNAKIFLLTYKNKLYTKLSYVPTQERELKGGK